MMKILNGPEVTAQLSAAMKDIARLTGFSEKDVTKGEAGAILKTWAGRTKVAQTDKIDLRSRRRVLHDLNLTQASAVGDITVNVGTRATAGLVWVKAAGLKGKGRPFRLAGVQGFTGSPFTASNRHWKSQDWTDIQSATQNSQVGLKRAMPLARQSVGLSRQSIIQIADKAGIDLSIIPGGGISPSQVSKARGATASNGRNYQNGTAQQQEETGKYSITLINTLPYLDKIGMPRTLAGVIAGRVGLYKRTFTDGAYKGIQSSARNYPWMRVNLTT